MCPSAFGRCLYPFSLFLSFNIHRSLSLLWGRGRRQFLLRSFRSYLFSYADGLQKILLRNLGHPQFCHSLSHLKDKSARRFTVLSQLYWPVIHTPSRSPFNSTPFSNYRMFRIVQPFPTFSLQNSFMISPKETPYPLIVHPCPSTSSPRPCWWLTSFIISMDLPIWGVSHRESYSAFNLVTSFLWLA